MDLIVFALPYSDRNRKIIPMLPSYTKLHYQYMRDQWPRMNALVLICAYLLLDYTPRLDHYVIKFQDFSVVFNSGSLDKGALTGLSDCFSRMLILIASLGEMKLLGKIETFLQSNRALDAQKIFTQCKECFLRIYMLDQSLAVRSEYYLQYLRCLKIVMKVRA